MDDGLLAAIAATAGTPVYVYDAGAIRARYAELDGALREDGARHHVHYSVKANSNAAILGVLRELGAGVDVVSGGELRRALAAGFKPEQVVFSGVGKTPSEIEDALRAGIGLINAESAAEIEAIACVSARLSAKARVGIRVNPDVTAETHPYTRTAERGMKFGVPLDEVIGLARRIRELPALDLASVGMHLGSQITGDAPYRAGAAKLGTLVAELRAAGITTLTSLDVGGGLGIAYADGEPALDPAAFADAVAPLGRATGLEILVEPGRYLVGNAGVLLTRVLYTKVSGGHRMLIVDAGMNDLLRPSLYQAVHPIWAVGARDAAATDVVDVVGPICETGDFLGLARRMPPARAGALLAVGGTGAYGFTMSSQYNSRPRPSEVLVDGEHWGVIRERESPEDLVRGEHGTPRWLA
jgi:diaminopimelate decarboxylase